MTGSAIQVRYNLFKIILVGFIKISKQLTVDIEYGSNATLIEYRNNDFRIGTAAAGDMTGKPVHIRNNDGLRNRPAVSAYTLSFPDSCAGQGSLKRPQYQFFANHAVKAYPKPAELFADSCGHIGHIGYRVVFALQQGPDLRQQRFVLFLSCS